MLKKISFYFTLFTLFFMHQNIGAVNWKTMLFGASLAAQLPDSAAHEYSVTNNLDVPVGLEYLIKHDIVSDAVGVNKVAVEFNCRENNQDSEETCSYRNFRMVAMGMTPHFATSIEPHTTLKIYTAGYTIANMKAEELHPEVSSFQYPFCWDCYKNNGIGDELGAQMLSKYRTFEINKGDLNSHQDLKFDRHFPQQKPKETVQEEQRSEL